MNRQSMGSIAICLAWCITPLSVAQTASGGAKVLEGMNISSAEIEELESGQVLTFSDQTYESTRRELAVDAMFLTDSDLDTIAAILTEDATVVPTHLIIESGVVNGVADFSGVHFTTDEYDEVEALFEAKPGKDHNFSKDEYALLQKMLGPYRNSDSANKIAAASAAMREILIARYNVYQARGLDGIDGYLRKKNKQVDVGHELRLTTETFKPFASDYPEYYKVMHDYPAGAGCCVHYYRWLKVSIRHRPTFVLAHTMIQKTDDFVLFTERYFYIASTLNSLQVTLSWLKYDDNTFVGLAMSASTDLLESMLARVLRPFGRNLAKDMVSDVMLDLKADLESDAEAIKPVND